MGNSPESEQKFEYGTLRVVIDADIATVWLNRPDARNAFHPAMIDELTEALTKLDNRKDLSALVLRGEGRSFCSGADLGYMRSMANYSLEENQKDSEKLFGMFWALRECQHPVIGRVHGHVMGGALGLVSQCDIVAAVNGTQFCFSEVKLGLVPAVISPFVLEKMHAHQAHRYMLTGEVFGVSEAVASGLVHMAGDEAGVDEFIRSRLHDLRRNGPEAVRVTKRLLHQARDLNDWRQSQEITTKAIAERRVSAEGQEGLRGFLEKRLPSWKLSRSE